MFRNLIVSVAGLAALVLAGSAGAAAVKARPRMGPGSLHGVWHTDTSYGFRNPDLSFLKEPYLARFEAVQAAQQKGTPIGDNTADCLPAGIPRVILAPYPLEILETPGQVTLITEYMGQVIRVFTDGRKHPSADALDPSYVGHSIGHWEGATLVVDTVGLRPDTQLDGALLPHSDALQVVHRYTRKGDKLEVEFTAIDPKAYSRPIKTTKVYDRRDDINIIEYVCLENNRNPNGADGVTRFVAPKAGD